ncbi:DUF4148 domain-containing protein [Ramlibacter sp. PS3R-8]|uniref:DUF4148 domain-containing protein n=1 Tax=Ramlibacter sp. PS3R-8 TaxID=3133437 RepID=UPI00309B2646
MNRKSFTIASVVLASAFTASAFAETPTIVTEPFVSTKTRVEVQAELAAYKQAGVNPWSTQYNPLRGFRSATTRDAVTADYVASRDAVRALGSEDSGSAYLAQQRSNALESSTLAGQPRNAQ